MQSLLCIRAIKLKFSPSKIYVACKKTLGKDTKFIHTFPARLVVESEDFNVTGAHMSVDISTRFTHYACIVVVVFLWPDSLGDIRTNRVLILIGTHTRTHAHGPATRN